MNRIQLKTANDHNYLYDRTTKCIIYLHPNLLDAINDKAGNKNEYYARKADFLTNSLELKKKKINSSSNISNPLCRKSGAIINYDEANIWNNIIFLDQILFEVTQKCNLDCEYCIYGKYYEYDKSRKNKDIDFYTAKILLDYILNIKIRNKVYNEITISFYGGEPLLNISFIEKVVEYLKVNFENQGFKFLYSLTTNGILLVKNIKFLIDNDFRVSVSLDGNRTSNSFRKFKNGINSYYEVYYNLKYLRQNYPEYFQEKVTFLTVLHKLNSIESVMKYFREEFEKTPSLSSIQIAGVINVLKDDFLKKFLIISEKNNSDPLSTIMELKTKHPVFKRIRDILSKEFDLIAHNYNILLNGRKISSYNRLPAGTCSPFELRLFLTVEGWIMPCEHIDFKFKLGHCTNDKVTLNLSSIKKFYDEIHAKHEFICSQCYFKENCSVCMLNMEYDSLGKPICTDFKSKSSFLKYLSDAISDIEMFPEIADAVFNN